MEDFLQQLGWDSRRDEELGRLSRSTFVPGRVIGASHELFHVRGSEDYGWINARRRLLDRAMHSAELPAVGDWVLVHKTASGAVVEELMERRSVFIRKSAGRTSKPQVVAANVDRVFVVTTVGNDFNPRRLERYLSLVWSGGAEPVLVVNKADQPHDFKALNEVLNQTAVGVDVVFVSATNGTGLDTLRNYCTLGLTVALVGSSGVGKSTLVNCLIGDERQKTSLIRMKDEKGRHTTSDRGLFLIPGGGVLLDTPGMRELGLWAADDGIEMTFQDVIHFAEKCKYRDCHHIQEVHCAVKAAVAAGELDQERVEHFLRLQRELEEQDLRRQPQNTKREWKEIHKAVRAREKLHRKLGLKS